MSFISNVRGIVGKPTEAVDLNQVAENTEFLNSLLNDSLVNLSSSPGFSVSSGSASSVVAEYFYKELGKLVFIIAKVSWTQNTSNASFAQLTLPFASIALASPGASANIPMLTSRAGTGLLGRCTFSGTNFTAYADYLTPANNWNSGASHSFHFQGIYTKA